MTSVAIIGCGPAGLAAAVALHDAGIEVCLFEQFSEPGPVGSGLMLQPTGLAVLDRWGMRESAEALGQRIDGMLGRVAPQGKVVLDINYNVLSVKQQNDLYGVAIHRASLFHVLYTAVQKRKISIFTHTRIHSISINRSPSNNRQHPAVRLVDNNGTTMDEAYDLVVDASGAQSKLAETVGHRGQSKTLSYGALWTTVKFDEQHFDRNLLEQRYDGAAVMVGVLPCGRLPNQSTELATLFWSIKGDQLSSFRTQGLAEWKRTVEKQWPTVRSLLNNIEHIDQLTHASYSHHTLKQPYAPGIVFLGDAAHATSPQLGQGVNMALLDALALSEAMKLTNNIQDLTQNYARMRSQHVKLFQAASYVLTPFYQSDSRLLPALRDTFFESTSKLPFASKLVALLGSGLLTDPVRTIDKIVERAQSRPGTS